MQTVTVLGKPKSELVGILSADESSLSIKVSSLPCVAGSSLEQTHFSESTADTGVKTAKIKITVLTAMNDLITGGLLNLLRDEINRERKLTPAYSELARAQHSPECPGNTTMLTKRGLPITFPDKLSFLILSLVS
jgi:hypothetical protein